MEEIIWQRYHPTLLQGLFVALEATFPKDAKLEFEREEMPPDFDPEAVVYRPKEGETVLRVYYPAWSVGFGKADSTKELVRLLIFYSPVLSPKPIYYNLVFRRKSNDPFMTCGRMDETKPFGFSLWEKGDKRDPYNVALAFPGRDGVFQPVFVLAEDGKNARIFEFEACFAESPEAPNLADMCMGEAALSEAPECLKKLVEVRREEQAAAKRLISGFGRRS